MEAAFAGYYKTTLLSEETDPNKLHDLRDSLDQLRIYTWEQVKEFVGLFLSNSDREELQPILNQCRQIYTEQLSEDDQVAQDHRYRNAKANTPNTAAIELDAALNRAVNPLFLDRTEFYKQFKDNSLFRNFVRGLVTRLINDNSGKSP